MNKQQINFFIDEIDVVQRTAQISVWDNDDNGCQLSVSFNISHEYTDDEYDNELGLIEHGYHEFAVEIDSVEVTQVEGYLDWQVVKDDIINDILNKCYQEKNQILDAYRDLV